MGNKQSADGKGGDAKAGAADGKDVWSPRPAPPGEAGAVPPMALALSPHAEISMIWSLGSVRRKQNAITKEYVGSALKAVLKELNIKSIEMRDDLLLASWAVRAMRVRFCCVE